MTRVYLVDDQIILRDGLHALLETAGHQVVGESSDPTQAVVEAQQRQAQVMLLDLGLGERSGFEVLDELKKRDSPVRALVLTMSAQPRHVAEAVRLGAAGYLLKDAGGAELLLAIATVANGRRYFGPQVADLALQALTSDAPADPFAILSSGRSSPWWSTASAARPSARNCICRPRQWTPTAAASWPR
jgi:DNA-binding NarL/FixJ family response regulator